MSAAVADDPSQGQITPASIPVRRWQDDFEHRPQAARASPNCPRYWSGTALSASSVVRMMMGRIITDSVKAPASGCSRAERSHKKQISNSPYTMDGMPDSVSAVMRTTPTACSPAGIFHKIWLQKHQGAAIRSDNTAIVMVLTSAEAGDILGGIFRAEQLRREFGIPLYRT